MTCVSAGMREGGRRSFLLYTSYVQCYWRLGSRGERQRDGHALMVVSRSVGPLPPFHQPRIRFRVWVKEKQLFAYGMSGEGIPGQAQQIRSELIW